MLRALILTALFLAPAAHALPGTAKVEDVQLVTQDDLKLAARFYVPKGSGRNPGVLLVHDAGSDSDAYDDFAEYLQKRGFGVLSLDLRGHGKSRTDDMAWKGLDEKEQERMWSFALRDIKAGVSWLKDRRDIHSSTISMVGAGAGCTLAVRHSVRDENVAAVVLVGPSSKQFGFDLPGDLSDLEGLPTLIVSESEERPIAVRLQEAGHRHASGPEFIEVKVVKDSADGVLSNRRTSKEVAGWLRDQVMPRK